MPTFLVNVDGVAAADVAAQLAEQQIGVWAHDSWYSLDLYKRLGYEKRRDPDRLHPLQHGRGGRPADRRAGGRPGLLARPPGRAAARSFAAGRSCPAVRALSRRPGHTRRAGALAAGRSYPPRRRWRRGGHVRRAVVRGGAVMSGRAGVGGGPVTPAARALSRRPGHTRRDLHIAANPAGPAGFVARCMPSMHSEADSNSRSWICRATQVRRRGDGDGR